MSSEYSEIQHVSEDQLVPVMPRRLSDVEVQSPEDSSHSANLGSHVWKHFTKDPDYKTNKKARCNYCGQTYTCSADSTTEPSKHLKKFHSTLLDPKKLKKVF